MEQPPAAVVSPLIRTHAVLRVEEQERRGRYLVSRVPLVTGDVVLRTEHYAMGVGERYKRLLCHRCLQSSQRKWTIACDACEEVFFCSDECRQRSISAATGFHQSGGECRALKAFAALQKNTRKAPPTSRHVEYQATWDQVRLCIMIAARYQREQAGVLLTEKECDQVLRCTFDDVMSMMDRREQLSKDQLDTVDYVVDTALACFVPKPPRSRRRHTAKVAEVNSQAGPIPRYLLREAFLKVRCNSFNVLDEAWDPIGVAMCPLASFFNHNCSPNVQFLYETDHVTVVATRDIAPGDEVVLCYTAEDMCLELRHEYLRHHYYFTCACARCVQEGDAAQLSVKMTAAALT